MDDHAKPDAHLCHLTRQLEFGGKCVRNLVQVDGVEFVNLRRRSPLSDIFCLKGGSDTLVDKMDE